VTSGTGAAIASVPIIV